MTTRCRDRRRASSHFDRAFRCGPVVPPGPWMTAAACATLRREEDCFVSGGEGDRWCRVCAEQYRILYRAAGLSNHTGRTVLEVLIAGLTQASGR